MPRHDVIYTTGLIIVIILLAILDISLLTGRTLSGARISFVGKQQADDYAARKQVLHDTCDALRAVPGPGLLPLECNQ